jgi:transcriptional regulator with XRE-family HTH domain
LKPHEILSRNLRLLRERHSLTQERVAEMCGIDYKFYQHIEAGRRPCVRLDTLSRLAKPFNLGPGEILLPVLPGSKIAAHRTGRNQPRTGGRSPKKAASESQRLNDAGTTQPPSS